ncbi:hypothetical protein AB0I28_06815 [Phytomonospora sp. NPDC050363]|uniref:hypothetical protein n=1 Tax=Phytomonospora sp. NPDC050363 TaxID=3155642 RepID=UPI0033E4719F
MQKSWRAVVVAAAVAAVIVGFASPAAAKPTPGNHSSAWVCETDEGGLGPEEWVRVICLTVSGSGGIQAYWYAWDERLVVYDGYPNGYHTYVYLSVATYVDRPFHTGESSEAFNLDFDEDLGVNLWVCSSSQDNAACSERVYSHT